MDCILGSMVPGLFQTASEAAQAQSKKDPATNICFYLFILQMGKLRSKRHCSKGEAQEMLSFNSIFISFQIPSGV